MQKNTHGIYKFILLGIVYRHIADQNVPFVVYWCLFFSIVFGLNWP